MLNISQVEYYIKWKNRSYMDCSWVKLEDLHVRGSILLRRYNKKVELRKQIKELNEKVLAAGVNIDNVEVLSQSIPDDIMRNETNSPDKSEKEVVQADDIDNKNLTSTRTPKEIIAPVSITPHGVIDFLVEWQEQDEEPGHITNEELKVRSPQVLIEFYQKNLSFH